MSWTRIAATIGMGLLGGVIFHWVRLPLPWMLGPMVVVMLGAVLRAPLASTKPMRPPFAAVLGVTLGSAFSPELLAKAGDWPLMLLGTVVSTVLIGGVGFLYLRKVARFDPVTAYFAGMPAGVYEMTAQGGQAGGDERRIALVHGVRIFLVVLAIPTIYAHLFGFGSTSGLRIAGNGPGGLADYALLVGAGLIGWRLAVTLRLPNASMLGPMVLSAALHLLGWAEAAPAPWLTLLAQLVVGSSIGSQFIDARPAFLASAVLHGLALVPLMCGVAALMAWGLSHVVQAPATILLLAMSPGGTTEMSLVALALHADVALVAANQVVRVVLINAFGTAAFRGLRRVGWL